MADWANKSIAFYYKLRKFRESKEVDLSKDELRRYYKAAKINQPEKAKQINEALNNGKYSSAAEIAKACF